MSNWVARKRQEAFALYQTYNAMRLHFKGSTGFDYVAYGGKVRGSFESFLEKNDVVKRFMQISAALTGVDNHELFIFANARYGIDIGYGDIRKCIKQFEEWNTKYGTKEVFLDSALGIFKKYCNGDDQIDMCVSIMLSEQDQEALIGYMHVKSDLCYRLTQHVKDNAILELAWNKLNKIRSMYYHFGILN